VFSTKMKSTWKNEVGAIPSIPKNFHPSLIMFCHSYSKRFRERMPCISTRQTIMSITSLSVMVTLDLEGEQLLVRSGNVGRCDILVISWHSSQLESFERRYRTKLKRIVSWTLRRHSHSWPSAVRLLCYRSDLPLMRTLLNPAHSLEFGAWWQSL